MRRALPQLVQHWRVVALVRQREPQLTALGVRQIEGDLDRPDTLKRLAGIADAVIHSAPPPPQGTEDTRTQNLIAILRRGKSLPRHLVYISTSGVYGDCGGARVSETHALGAKSARAVRRVDAERCLRQFGSENGCHCRVSILRAPGIYAGDRLPLERLRQRLPLIVHGEDSHTNHIHADDLGRACIAALARGQANRIYNVNDNSSLAMGEWFDALADAFALPRAPRLPREEVRSAVPPLQWSFMAESRRLDNTRMKHELRLRLRYPTVAEGISAALMEKASSCAG
jgi:nucleoside-diphosphate-sugar epimerase